MAVAVPSEPPGQDTGTIVEENIAGLSPTIAEEVEVQLLPSTCVSV